VCWIEVKISEKQATKTMVHIPQLEEQEAKESDMMY
jgi:hypothetical protein